MNRLKLGGSFKYPFNSLQAPLLTNPPDAQLMGTNDVLLYSPLVLGCAHTMPVWDFSGQHVSHCFGVKMNKNLAGYHF